MPITIEEFVAELGWDIDSSELKDFKSQVKDVYDDVAKLTKYVVAGSSAILGMSVVVNNATAEQTNLARSVGASAETIEALAASLGGIGLQADNVIDLVEELNNKFGELGGLGEMSSATDALKLLKLNFKDLKDLAPEEQFIRILDAAKQLGNSQQAVSAVDMLMGGEANKVLGYIRTLDGSLGDIVQRYRDLSFLTDDGREGAVKFAAQWRDLSLVGKSLSKEFFGRMGDALEPLIDETLAWVEANKDVVSAEVIEWAENFAEAVTAVAHGFREVDDLIHRLGGYKTVLGSIGIAFGAWKIFPLLESLTSMVQLIPAIGDLGPAIAKVGPAIAGLKFARFAAFLGLAGISYMAFQDLWVSLKGGKSAFSSIHEGLGEVLSSYDEFWADMLGMPVDEYRAKMLDSINAVQQGFSDFYSFMVSDFEAFIGKVDNFVSAIVDDIMIVVNTFRSLFGGDVVALPSLGRAGTKGVKPPLPGKPGGDIRGLIGPPGTVGPSGAPGAPGAPGAVVQLAPSEGMTIEGSARRYSGGDTSPSGGSVSYDNRQYTINPTAQITGIDRDTHRALLRDLGREMEQSISHALRSAGD